MKRMNFIIILIILIIFSNIHFFDVNSVATAQNQNNAGVSSGGGGGYYGGYYYTGGMGLLNPMSSMSIGMPLVTNPYTTFPQMGMITPFATGLNLVNSMNYMGVSQQVNNMGGSSVIIDPGMSSGMYGGGMYGGIYGGGMYGGMYGGGMYGGMYGGGMYGGMYGSGMYGGMYGGGMYGGGGMMDPLLSLLMYPFLSQSIYSPLSLMTGMYYQNMQNMFLSGISPYGYGMGFTGSYGYALTVNQQMNEFGIRIGNSNSYGPVDVKLSSTAFKATLTFKQEPYTGIVCPVNVSIQGTTAYGFVHNVETGEPVSGVKVEVEGRDDLVTTNINGFYSMIFYNYQEPHFTFTKKGFLPAYNNVSIQGEGLLYILPVYIRPSTAPILQIQEDTIYAVVGEEITLDPIAYDLDPNDEASIVFSEWKKEAWTNNGSYTPTEEDVGTHSVIITAKDTTGLEEQKEVLIHVLSIEDAYTMKISAGFNLISYPFEDGDPNFLSYDLLQVLGGPTKIIAIEAYLNSNNTSLRSYYDDNDEPAGDNFLINIGEGYIVYAKDNFERNIYNGYTGEPQTISLSSGINLIGIASYPDGYTSYNLLWDLGINNADSVYYFNTVTGEWLSSYWLGNETQGDLFPIEIGVGYKLIMKTDMIHTFSRARFFF